MAAPDPAVALPPVNQRAGSDAALCCGICMVAFDAGFRRPLILSRCGHTFCRLCIKDLATRASDIICPSCRCKYENTDPDSFPINFNIQCLAAACKVFPTLTPEMENNGNLCAEHEIRLAFWCNSCEAALCGECLYEAHPRPTHTICRIQEVVEQVKERARVMAEQSNKDTVVCLGRSLSRTLQDVSDVQEAAHLLQETGRVNRLAHAAQDLASITSVFEASKAVNQRVATLSAGQGGAGGDVASIYIERTLTSRPNILALSDSGGLAPVTVEEKGIHIFSLRPTSTAYSVAIKLNVLMSCVRKDQPLAFLDIKAGERRLGRLYITLEGTMRRAQQFMALCLGSLGPTYRGTRFDGMSERGLPGEFVRGGDYQGRAGLGGEAVMDNLEWDGQWSKPKAAGQVCGVGGEDQKKFGALFAICLRDNPEDTFRCPFGKVCQGLDVLEVACRHEPFSKVHVADCGVLIPL
ncbi:uncharacterized protein [Panulirus ornatus]|uniref:uncharacterized protein n=1 Tax=Panulirus ornatus TaxID=150431 RepID=UPI003A84DBA3